MENTKYIYKGTEFIKRAKKTFKPYQIKGIWLQKKYDDFIKEFIGDDIQKSANKNLFSNAELLKSVTRLENNPEEVGRVFLQNENGMQIMNYLQLKQQANELFILDEQNAKELMEILFENHQEMVHDTETDEDAKEYEKFMIEVLNLFFSIFKKQIGI